MDSSFDMDETRVCVLIIVLNCVISRSVLEQKHHDIKSTKVNRNICIYFTRLQRKSCMVDLIKTIDLKKVFNFCMYLQNDGTGKFPEESFFFLSAKEHKNWEEVSCLWSNWEYFINSQLWMPVYSPLFSVCMSVVISSILICTNTLHKTFSERFIVLVFRCVVTFPYLWI